MRWDLLGEEVESFSSYSGSHHFDSSVPLAIVVPPLFIRRSEEYMALCLCFESAPRLFPISLYELYHATPWYPNEGCFPFGYAWIIGIFCRNPEWENLQSWTSADIWMENAGLKKKFQWLKLKAELRNFLR